MTVLAPSSFSAARLQPALASWKQRWACIRGLGLTGVIAFFVGQSLSTAALAGPQAQAVPSASTVQSQPACLERPIRLAFYEYGFLYFQEGERARGIDKEFIDALAARSGCRFEFQVLARARIWADLERGQLDMSVSGIRTPERERFAWFAHYLSMKNHVLLRSALSPVQRSSAGFAASTGLQFGTVRAFRHGEWQDQWLEPLRKAQRVQESANVEVLFRKLRQGRIDAMFSQPPVYRKFLTPEDMKHLVIQDWAPDSKGVPHGLILAKSSFSAPQAEQWQHWVNELRADGTLRQIFERYMPSSDLSGLLDF
jgi:polar amino acid transport system substrate-binding protein